MSDGLRRSITAVIGAAGIAYIAWLMSQGQTFVVESLVPYQLYIGIGFIVLFVVFVFALALRPLAIKRLKWWVVAFSLAIILLGQYMLIDKADAGIYAGDIVALIGVLIFFLALAGVLITKKAKRQVEKAMQEVIEV